MATSNIAQSWRSTQVKALCDSGAYYSVGTIINLNTSYTNFKWLIFRLGWDSEGMATDNPSGTTIITVPTKIFLIYDYLNLSCILHSKLYSLTVHRKSDTALEISSSTFTDMGIRVVYGMN